MNCYTLTAPGRLSAGIALSPAGAVRLGEAGRGRTMVDVPVPAGSITRAARPVPAGDDPDPNNTETLVSVPAANRPAGTAVVLIRDHSGFRGGWHLRTPRTPEAWIVFHATERAHGAGPAEAHPGRSLSACPACSVYALAGQFGPHAPAFPAGLEIIAEGYSAQGLAGGMGGGPEYLIVLNPGQAAEIVREGRLYGQPAVLRLANEAGVVSVTDPEAAAASATAAARW